MRRSEHIEVRDDRVDGVVPFMGVVVVVWLFIKLEKLTLVVGSVGLLLGLFLLLINPKRLLSYFTD